MFKRLLISLCVLTNILTCIGCANSAQTNNTIADSANDKTINVTVDDAETKLIELSKSIPTTDVHTFTATFIYSSDAIGTDSYKIYGVHDVTQHDCDYLNLIFERSGYTCVAKEGDIILKVAYPITTENPIGEHIVLEKLYALVHLRVADEYGNLIASECAWGNTIIIDEYNDSIIQPDYSAFSDILLYSNARPKYYGNPESFPEYPITILYSNAVDDGYINKTAANYTIN